MIFGTRLGANASARPTPIRLCLNSLIAVCCLTALLAPLAGCSGGSSSARSGDISQTGNAFITGRVVDNRTGTAVGGAQITVNGQTVTTGNDGLFRVQVPAGRNDLFVKVTGTGSNTFYDTGRYGDTNISLGTTGIQLPALNGGDEFSLGDIRVFLSSDPPPPPI